jgi:hypothetical protein
MAGSRLSSDESYLNRQQPCRQPGGDRPPGSPNVSLFKMPRFGWQSRKEARETVYARSDRGLASALLSASYLGPVDASWRLVGGDRLGCDPGGDNVAARCARRRSECGPELADCCGGQSRKGATHVADPVLSRIQLMGGDE